MVTLRKAFVLLFIIPLPVILTVSCQGKSQKAYSEFVVINDGDLIINSAQVIAISENSQDRVSDTTVVFELTSPINPGQRSQVFRHFYRDFSESGKGVIYVNATLGQTLNSVSNVVGEFSKFSNSAHKDSTPSHWKTYELLVNKRQEIGVFLTYYENGEKIKGGL